MKDDKDMRLKGVVGEKKKNRDSLQWNGFVLSPFWPNKSSWANSLR